MLIGFSHRGGRTSGPHPSIIVPSLQPIDGGACVRNSNSQRECIDCCTTQDFNGNEFTWIDCAVKCLEAFPTSLPSRHRWLSDSNCSGIIDRCKNDPLVQRSLERVYSACGQSVTSVSIHCTPSGNPGRGSWDCGPRNIWLRSSTDCGALAHELLHVADQCHFDPACRYRSGTKEYCEHLACMEARAIGYITCCDLQDPGRRNGQTWAECVSTYKANYDREGRTCAAAGLLPARRWDSIWKTCLPANEQEACRKSVPQWPAF